MKKLRYCGEYYDSETGFIYLRARYYDTTTGRFISEDPARDGINWYAYCAGNPVMYVDPSGEVAVEVAEAFIYSPMGQQIIGQLTALAEQAGVSLTTYVVENYPMIVQAANCISQYGAAAWDWTTNTAVPWVIEKAQQAISTISNEIDKVVDWVKEKVNNSNGEDPNKKPSLKNVNNKTANDIAKENGFKDAHEFKESFVGKSNISKFNIKIDKNTGEIYLESVKKGGKLIATGYYG